ncbi:MAG: RNA-directed DNA polymerase [Myxococcales bacterium]|nr:RNA-directed DNA polymerase [Myxococcales bacterium]MCB9756384.1 RNA-directed DNA polymerase [Myxococcales bacterium]
MSRQPSTREELYERIRNSSKDEVILEEMVRLGFWPAASGQPGDPGDEIRRRGELQRKLNDLRTKVSRLYNEQQLISDQRKQRLAESRRKRQETKERRERERQQKAELWRQRKEREVLYLGDGVSGGLLERKTDQARLVGGGLPVLAGPEAVAASMGITVGALRFLAYSRRVSRISHYRRFSIPKKTGGRRLISAPMPRLKAAQRWILENILERVPVHEAAHGFLERRSIVTNAVPHVGADVVINLDLKDFFPTVTYERVKGLFVSLGYSESVATVLALLSTEPEVAELELDGNSYYAAQGPRHLPQGSPASPAITNLLCRRLDRRLQGLARKHGYQYTRYADDLTFSARGMVSTRSSEVGRLLRGVADIVTHEGFEVHPEKTRVMRRGRRLEVTGIVINDKLSVDRKTLRRFRATLFQVERDGPEGKRWGESKDLMAALLGYASFVAMVDPQRGRPLISRVRAVHRAHGYQPAAPKRRAAPPTAASTAPSSPARDTTASVPTPDRDPDPTPPPGKKKKKWKLW